MLPGISNGDYSQGKGDRSPGGIPASLLQEQERSHLGLLQVFIEPIGKLLCIFNHIDPDSMTLSLFDYRFT